MNHDAVEKKVGLLGVLIALVISVGGLVEIVPLFFQASVTQPAPGIKPYEALRLEGRDIYVREGCYLCHSQMIRPLRDEVERVSLDLAAAAEREQRVSEGLILAREEYAKLGS